MRNGFALVLILIFTVSSAIMVIPSLAQTPTPSPLPTPSVTASPVPIPTPNVPEFTVKLVGPPYIVNTSYSLDQNTGKIVAQIGYTNEYSLLEITIKNQPFTPFVGDNYGNVVQILYNVRIKPSNETDNWIEVYNPYNGYPTQSNSENTTITISIEGQMQSPLASIAGSQSDVQVEALAGYIHRVVIGFGAPWVFNGTESGWSNAQTVTIPANVALNSAATSSPSTQTPTTSPLGGALSSSNLLLILTAALVIIAVLLIIIGILLLHLRKRRNP